MIISHCKKFIFIHIDKTGGLSISSQFEPYNYRYSFRNRVLSNLKIYPKIYLESFHKEDMHNRRHLTAQHIKKQIKELIGKPDIFNNYYKFTFVRNPYDRLISSFEFLQSTRTSNKFILPKDIIEIRDKYKDFKSYVIDFRLKHYINSQYEYIYSKERDCLVDFIGHLETINEDMFKICTHLNIKHKVTPHLNMTPKLKFEEYFDNDLVSIVNYEYSNDFDFFGYTKL